MDNPVIFYDGQCKICNLAVGFVIRHDSKNKFRFSSLQSEAAIAFLPGIQVNKQNPESIVYRDGEKIYQGSTAILKILKQLGRGWQMLHVFIILPPAVRDSIYYWFARNRYRWFGMSSACPLIPRESRLG